MDSSNTNTALPRGKSGKVLIIEDEQSQRILLSTFLSSMGAWCVTTSSGEAFAFLEREAFDAVLLDLSCSEVPAEQLSWGSRARRRPTFGEGYW